MNEDKTNSRQRAAQRRGSARGQSQVSARASRSGSGSPAASSRKPTVRKAASGSTRAPQARESRPGARSASHASHAGSHTRRSTARASGSSAQGGTARARRGSQPAKKKGIFERIVSNRAVVVTLAVVLALVVAGALDSAANWGRAYGNVTVNGVSVGGMTEDEIIDKLKGEFGSRVSHAQITIYADEEAKNGDGQGEADEDYAIAEQLSVEDALETASSWKTDALSLKASVPYGQAAREALSIGREDGGLAARLGLLFAAQDVTLGVDIDSEALEQLASEIDRSIGDPRVDSTVVVEGREAQAVEGHDGTMVDRSWLESMISRAMIRGDVPDSFVAVVSAAPERIGMAEAQEMASAVNRAIAEGAMFYYQGRSWLAGPAVLGEWTRVDVAGEEGSWHLEASIDSSSAIPAVVEGAGAAITAEDTTVQFEKDSSDVMVHTSGTGSIPEVAPAVSELGDKMYGAEGIAWGQGADAPVEVTISESDRPESLSFDQAVDLGVITVIGEYTTEFTNLEGTENRNHNIKLCADILNDAIIESNGGEWNFNERSGDTNEDAGFWSAGSIVDGEFVDSIGGGICQVATTIFNAVYEAGLDVVERHNHTIYIASYPTGRDAAVSYPDLDFIWENKLPSDILMKLSYTDTSVTAQLYSVYTGYSASTETGAWEDGKKYSVVYERDDSLAPGYYYLKTVGEDGSSITVERTVYDKNGKTLKTEEFYSEYAAKDQVYVVGPDVDTSQLARPADDDQGSSVSSASYEYDDYDYGSPDDYSVYGDDMAWY